MRFEDVAVGQAIPELVKPAITTRQLVEYAGASGDFNRIHYDEPFARAAGFPQVIAHGMLSMAFLGELVARWGGGPHAIQRLSARFKAVTFPGDVITCSGEVVALDAAARTAQLAVRARKQDGIVTVEGTATVQCS
jgi:acyl dehydratase